MTKIQPKIQKDQNKNMSDRSKALVCTNIKKSIKYQCSFVVFLVTHTHKNSYLNQQHIHSPLSFGTEAVPPPVSLIHADSLSAADNRCINTHTVYEPFCRLKLQRSPLSTVLPLFPNGNSVRKTNNVNG